MAPLAVNDAVINPVAVLLCNTAVTASPDRRALAWLLLIVVLVLPFPVFYNESPDLTK
jgi:hypothetical protein